MGQARQWGGREKTFFFLFFYPLLNSFERFFFKNHFKLKGTSFNKIYAAAWMHKHVSRPYSEF